jgi:hypothetical protein
MKIYRISIFLLLISLFPTSVFTQSDDLREYYPLQEGNSWIYEQITLSEEKMETTTEEVRIEGKENVNGVETKKMIYKQNEESYYLAEDAEGVKVYKIIHVKVSEIHTPPVIILPFRIEEEREHKFENSYTEYDNQNNINITGKQNIEIRYEGREDVVVPAGEFRDCIKISMLISFKDSKGGFGKISEVMWLAKGIGVVRKTDENFEYIRNNIFPVKTEYKLKSAVIDNKNYGLKIDNK